MATAYDPNNPLSDGWSTQRAGTEPIYPVAQDPLGLNATFGTPAYTLASRPAATGSGLVIFVSDLNGGTLQKDTAAATWTPLAPGSSQAATPALAASAALTANYSMASGVAANTGVDVAGLSVTFTAMAGATYSIRGLYCLTVAAGANTGYGEITDGSNNILDVQGVTQTNSAGIRIALEALVTPSAGSVTYKARIAFSALSAAGSVVVVGGATFPSRLTALRVA
jgi:hypothetical protein